jgi:hypothetical protein
MANLDQANMLLRGSRDANDHIRDQNNANTRTWESVTKPGDERDKEGEEYYHGVTDAMTGSTFGNNAYKTYARMQKLGGVSYGELASIDGRNFGNSLSKLGQGAGDSITSIKSGVSVAGEKVGNTISDIGAKSMGITEDAPLPALKASSAGGEAVGGGFKGVQSTADLSTDELKSAKVNFGELSQDSSSTVSDVGKGAGAVEGETGGIQERALAKLTGGEVGSLGGAALGKAVGNIGGAIDIVKDFDNVGKKGGFFAGSGSTTGDEVSNALTVGGTILDVASVALPFLAPVAGAVSLIGAGLSTYEAIKDANTKEADDKGDYGKGQTNLEVPPSLAGTGFLASHQINQKSMIAGSGAF